MTELINKASDRIASYQVRERIVAIICLTGIAMVAIMRLSDPENVIINIVVAIAGFMAGKSESRLTDKEKIV